VADSGSVAEVARLLVAASHPVIIADKLRTAAAMPLLIELAEALQAKVVSQTGLRTNFPTHHPLHRLNDSLADADLVLGLETRSFAGVVRDVTRSSRPVQAKTITITAENLNMQPPDAAVDLAIAADAEATLPALIEAVKRLITPERKSTYEARGAKFAQEKAAELNRWRVAATYGWDLSPISTARLSAELWDQFRHEDWALVGQGQNYYHLETFLWNCDKPYRTNGSMGGGGLGYGMPAAVGSALAHKKYGRVCLNSQRDGDFLFCPTALWTAAKYQIPLLTVMRNNRAYHQEVMEVQRWCNRMNRGIDRASIGNEIAEPNIDYAKLAQSMGVYAEGPIQTPKDLAPAIKRAIAVVKRGEPALLDVLIQAR
jgi:acetolactate synthase I/II/III large subunit